MAPTATPGSRRLLLDTNVMIGALLWSGPPLALMEQAVEDGVALYSSPVLMAELEHTLNYPRFIERLAVVQADVSTLMRRYESIVTLVEPTDGRAWYPTTPTTITSVADLVSSTRREKKGRRP